MNHAEIAARLRDALERTGRTAWELSRRADAKESLVDAVLTGSRMAPVEAVCRVASALDMELVVIAAAPPARVVGTVKTVVDIALERLEAIRPKHEADGGRTTDQANSFVTAEREALARVHEFVGSSEFDAMARRLVEPERARVDGAWLAEWLMRPAVGLGGRPIDLLQQPGGSALVNARLEQIALNVHS